MSPEPKKIELPLDDEDILLQQQREESLRLVEDLAVKSEEAEKLLKAQKPKTERGEEESEPVNEPINVDVVLKLRGNANPTKAVRKLEEMYNILNKKKADRSPEENKLFVQVEELWNRVFANTESLDRKERPDERNLRMKKLLTMRKDFEKTGQESPVNSEAEPDVFVPEALPDQLDQQWDAIMVAVESKKADAAPEMQPEAPIAEEAKVLPDYYMILGVDQNLPEKEFRQSVEEAFIQKLEELEEWDYADSVKKQVKEVLRKAKITLLSKKLREKYDSEHVKLKGMPESVVEQEPEDEDVPGQKEEGLEQSDNPFGEGILDEQKLKEKEPEKTPEQLQSEELENLQNEHTKILDELISFCRDRLTEFKGEEKAEGYFTTALMRQTGHREDKEKLAKLPKEEHIKHLRDLVKRRKSDWKSYQWFADSFRKSVLKQGPEGKPELSDNKPTEPGESAVKLSGEANEAEDLRKERERLEEDKAKVVEELAKLEDAESKEAALKLLGELNEKIKKAVEQNPDLLENEMVQELLVDAENPYQELTAKELGQAAKILAREALREKERRAKAKHFTSAETLRQKTRELFEMAKDNQPMDKQEENMLNHIKRRWKELSKASREEYKKRYLQKGISASEATGSAVLDFAVDLATNRFKEISLSAKKQEVNRVANGQKEGPITIEKSTSKAKPSKVKPGVPEDDEFEIGVDLGGPEEPQSGKLDQHIGLPEDSKIPKVEKGESKDFEFKVNQRLTLKEEFKSKEFTGVGSKAEGSSDGAFAYKENLVIIGIVGDWISVEDDNGERSRVRNNFLKKHYKLAIGEKDADSEVELLDDFFAKQEQLENKIIQEIEDVDVNDFEELYKVLSNNIDAITNSEGIKYDFNYLKDKIERLRKTCKSAKENSDPVPLAQQEMEDLLNGRGYLDRITRKYGLRDKIKEMIIAENYNKPESVDLGGTEKKDKPKKGPGKKPEIKTREKEGGVGGESEEGKLKKVKPGVWARVKSWASWAKEGVLGETGETYDIGKRLKQREATAGKLEVEVGQLDARLKEVESRQAFDRDYRDTQMKYKAKKLQLAELRREIKELKKELVEAEKLTN